MMTFYVNMQKRGDGRIYTDLHKTDGHIYFKEEEAQAAIDAQPDLKQFRHVVELVAVLPEDLP